jgi:phage/plasmid-like protein (TIGR03299 family)
MATTKINLAKQGKITSIEDALDSANLNFIAEDSEMMSPTHGVFAPDHKMIIRSDTNAVLGVVGKKYHATQNSLAMAFMDSIVQKNGFHYTEAISKDNGAVSVITAQSERPDVIKVGDEVARQIKIINGFNGKHSLSVEFSMLRLVCTNGMVRSERESVMRFKHTIHIQNRMEIALRVFDESLEFHEEFINVSKQLSQKSVDKLMVEKFLNGLYGDAKQNDKKKEMIVDLFQNGQGNKGETLWDLYNGTTEYVDHFYGKEEKRDEYATFGTGHKLKEKAWSLATSLL